MFRLQAITRAKLPFHEQRRSPREQVQFPAWIDLGDGSPRRECTVLDVSDDGARIMAASSAFLPKKFWLVFTKHGTRRRKCRIVWRSGEQIGVAYLGPVEYEYLS